MAETTQVCMQGNSVQGTRPDRKQEQHQATAQERAEESLRRTSSKELGKQVYKKSSEELGKRECKKVAGNFVTVLTIFKKAHKSACE